MKALWIVAVLGVTGTQAWADEWGRVISSTAVQQQVAVPQQVCSPQAVAVAPPKSGAGAVMGALAGGALGSAVGDGSGRALATMAGVIGGAVMGDRIEAAPPTQIYSATQCNTQVSYETRVTAYNVVYEYAGRQYQAQLPYDPGPTIRLQISPAAVSSVSPAPGALVQAAAPVYVQAVDPAPPVYYAPAYRYYYPPAYYPPVGLSLNFGLYGGGHRHWR